MYGTVHGNLQNIWQTFSRMFSCDLREIAARIPEVFLMDSIVNYAVEGYRPSK